VHGELPLMMPGDVATLSTVNLEHKEGTINNCHEVTMVLCCGAELWLVGTQT
jgi:hypothetical protein